ncbi:hypothetical protein CF327_g3313 [Tilletia walkeri]|nr:hypothetical protein CF327_g3313 [Tilletia walkeri]
MLPPPSPSSGAGAGPPGTPVASVTYAATTALMHSALPGHLFTTLAPHLPLHNLHWKPDPPLSHSFSLSSSSTTTTTNPIRTIQSLPLSFEPLSLAHTRAQQIQHHRYNPTAPQNATSQILDPAYPFVHLYLVLCPDSDTYRSTIRNDIRSWLVGIGAFSAALQVSASGFNDDPQVDPQAVPASISTPTTTASNGTTTNGTSSGSGTKSDKHSSLPALSEPEFLIILITPPEGMPDLSTTSEPSSNNNNDDTTTAAGTPPAAATQDLPGTTANANASAPAPAVPPKPKPTRTSTGSTSGTGGFFSSMTASKNKGASAVLEKMRADFNANKRERVVHISRLPPIPSRPAIPHRASSVGDDLPTTPRTASAQLDPTIFIDLLTRLKECSSNSLSVILKTRMASIRALLSAIEELEPGPASPYWASSASLPTEGDQQDEGSRLFAHYIQSQAFVLRCLEGLGLWEDALEGWNSVADTYMRLVLGGHDPFAPAGATILSAAISQITLPMPHPALLKAANQSFISPSTPTLVDPTDLLPALPAESSAALEFRIALYTRRATIQGAYLNRVLHVLQEGANEVRDIGRSLVRERDRKEAASRRSAADAAAEGDDQTPVFAKGSQDQEDEPQQQQSPSIPNLEAEVWTYQAALQLSRTCDSWVADRGGGEGESSSTSANASSSSLNLGATSSPSSSSAQTTQTSPAFHAARAEMLEVARRQMDRMGILVGWLPAEEPWLTGCGSGGGVSRIAGKGRAAVVQVQDEAAAASMIPDAVKSLFSSREIFDLRYSSLTERVLSASMLASSSTAPMAGSLSAVPSSVAGSAGSGPGSGSAGTMGRRRQVLFLRIILTSLDLVRARWREAYTALGPLADSCAPTISGPVPISGQSVMRAVAAAGSGWAAMEAVLRGQYLRCHAALGLPRDRVWVGAVVAWLRASISAKSRGVGVYVVAPALSKEEEEEGELSSVIDESTVFAALRSAAASLDKEVAVSGFSPFEVLPAERTATRELELDTEHPGTSKASTRVLETDGHLLKVRIRSALGIELRVDDVRLCLTNGEREQLWFTSGKIVLQGTSSSMDEHQVVQLYCASSATGTYAVDVAQVRIAKVIFQIPLLPHSTPSSSADVNTAYAPGRMLFSQGSRGVPASMGLFSGLRSGMPFLVHIPEDAEALQATIRLPEVIRLGERRCGIIEIRTGRNMVQNADVTLLMLHDAAGGGSTAMSGLGEAELVSGSDDDVAAAAAAGGRVELVLPSASGSDKVQLKNVPARSVVRLRFPLLEAASLGTIPLMLSIDYYSSGGGGGVTSAVDSSSSSTSVAPLRRQFRRVQDLLASLPLGVNAQDFFRRDYMLCKFTITSVGGSRLRIQSPTLTSVKKKRQASSDEEEAAVERYVVRSPMLGGSQSVAVAPKQPASFVFRLSPTSAVREAGKSGPTILELTLRYQAILDTSVAGGSADEEEGDAWQTIVIPVEVPSMDLVNEVNFDFLARGTGKIPGEAASLSTLELQGGQPVRARFTVVSTKRWSHLRPIVGGTTSKEQDQEQEQDRTILLYDIVSDLDTWLICGSTRGTLVVGSESVQLDITLIPLRDGSLPLPQLALKPLDVESISSETYMMKASSRVLVSLRSRPVQNLVTMRRATLTAAA